MLPAILLAFLAFFAFSTPISVQAAVVVPPPGGAPFTADTFKAQESNGYTWLNFFEYTAPCMGVKWTAVPTHFCPQTDPVTGNLLQVANGGGDGGAVGGLNTAMVAMYNSPPTSTTEYLAYVGSNLGLVPKAYAQVTGSGSGVIQPVFRLWEIVRDVSYLGFILVFIVIGFMIMFRQRLNPQTVITVQSALPGLVIGLILVTFSYFIAALLVDVSFFVFQLVGGLFIQAGGNGIPDLPNLAQKGNIIELFRLFALNGDTISTVTAPIINAFNDTSGGITLQGIVITALGSLVPGGTNSLGGGISGVIVTILVIAVIFQGVRLVWAMLQAYISIFVNTILGPIFILYSTLPGRRGALTFWWKNILGNALIFPAVFAAVLFAGLIVGTPPDQFGASMPLLSFPQGLLRGILAFGIVLGTPAIPKMVKSAMGVKDLGEIATAAAAGAAAGYGLSRAGGQKLVDPYLRERAAYGAEAAKQKAQEQFTTKSAPFYVRIWNR